MTAVLAKANQLSTHNRISCEAYVNQGSSQPVYYVYIQNHYHERPMSGIEQAERLYGNVRRAVDPLAASAAHKAQTAFQKITCHGRAGVEQLRERADELYTWLNTPGRDGLTPLQKAGVAAAATTAGVLSLLVIGAAMMLPFYIAKKGISALTDKLSEEKETSRDKYQRLTRERETLVESMRSAKYEYMIQEQQKTSCQKQLESLRTQEQTAETRAKIQHLEKKQRKCQSAMDAATKHQLEIQKKIQPVINELRDIKKRK